jgi:hypothetical protein
VARVVHRDRVEPLLFGGTEPDRDLGYARRYEQHVSAESVRQKTRGEVLVDDGLDADKPSIGLYRHRNPAASGRHHDAPGVDERANDVGLQDS